MYGWPCTDKWPPDVVSYVVYFEHDLRRPDSFEGYATQLIFKNVVDDAKKTSRFYWSKNCEKKKGIYIYIDTPKCYYINICIHVWINVIHVWVKAFKKVMSHNACLRDYFLERFDSDMHCEILLFWTLWLPEMHCERFLSGTLWLLSWDWTLTLKP